MMTGRILMMMMMMMLMMMIHKMVVVVGEGRLVHNLTRKCMTVRCWPMGRLLLGHFKCVVHNHV